MKPPDQTIEHSGGRGGIAARGLLWLMAQSAIARAAMFLGQIALARLLSPHDFGTIGLTYTITMTVGALVGSGIGDVLVQRSRNFHLWAWPGFLIDLALASMAAALVLVLAPFGARLYAAPELAGLAWVLAIAMPLSALSTIPLTALRVALNFRLLATVGVAEAVAVQILSVLLAWHGMGAYSFVVPMPIVEAGKAVCLWAIVRPRLRRTRPRPAWFHLVRSGFWIWSHRLLVGVISQGDYFLLGLFASRREVGLYFFAFRLSAQPLYTLAGNVSGVMYPVLAQLRTRPQEQSEAARQASQMLAAAIFFVACLQAALASPILHLLFRHRWDGSIPLNQALSIGLAFDAVPWIAGGLFRARGEFRKACVCMLVATPCFFCLVGIGAWLGRALGVATAVGVYYAVFGPCYSYVAMRQGIGATGILRLYLSPLIVAGSAVGAAHMLANVLFGSNFPAFQAVSIVVFATGFYAGLLRLCMPGIFFEIGAQATFLVQRLRRQGGRRRLPVLR